MNDYFGATVDEMPERIDLIRILDRMWKGFRRYFPLIILLIMLCAGFMYRRARMSYRPQYLASATFTVTVDNQSLYGTGSYNNNTTASQLESTFPYLLTSGSLSKIIAADLGVQTLNGLISASVMPDTNLFTIEVRSENPQTARDILDSVIQNYPQVAEQVIGSTKLEMLDYTGVPTEPVSLPNFARSTVKGGILGLILGLLFLMGYAINRQTIQREEDIQKYIHAECLSVIPLAAEKKRSHAQTWTALIDNPHIPQGFVESIRVLRTHLEREARKHESKVLLVSSTAPGEGKSTIAANIAMSLAMNGKKVLLMDCDIRNPSLGRILGIKKGKGVYEFISGKAKLDEVLQYDKAHQIYVLPGGKPYSDASEILDCQRMRELLKSARASMDYVILDTAPVGMLTDTAVLAELTDGVLFVIKHDYAKTSHIVEAVEQLSESHVPMLGCVLNCVNPKSGDYGYGYHSYYHKNGYSHYGTHYGSGEKTQKQNARSV